MKQGPYALAIETSTPVASTALSRSGEILAEVVLGPKTRHSEQLLPAIDYVCRIAAVDRTELARIVIGGGPGSFTGLRIAAATAKGLVAGLDLDMYAYSGLLAVAAGTGVRDQPVCALFDARRSEVYAACYRIGGIDPAMGQNGGIETVMPPCVESIDTVLASLATEQIVFAGEGAVRHTDRIRSLGGIVLPAHIGMPRASSLLWLLERCAPLGQVSEPGHWEPDYLRGAGAERGIAG